MNKRNVLLVRPARIKQAITLGEIMYAEPIGLEMVYTVLAPLCNVQILDLMVPGESLMSTIEQFKPNYIGITSLCIDVNAVIAIAECVKRYNPKIVTFVGGTQAFLNPRAFYHAAIDHVFQYTTQQNLTEFVTGQQEPGRVINGVHSRHNHYRVSAKHGRNAYIVPNRNATAKYRQHYSYFGYRPCAIMQTSFGCSKACHFCLRWRIEGANECDLPLEHVIDQIETIKESSIMIFDNDFLYNGERLEHFCNMIEARKINKNFICYGSVNSVNAHPQTIKRLATCGLRAVLIGYESFADSELNAYNKKSSVSDSYKAAATLKHCGIDAWASFILHPDWDRADFKQFRRYIKQLSPEITTFSPLTPFANLPMYHDYQARLLASVQDYEKWSFGEVTIAPSKLTLRRYYLEMLRTLLYVNFVQNSAGYLVRKFGIATLLRISKGSMAATIRYVKLIMQAGRQ